LIYLAGRRWFGPRAGWLAGFCAAVSPFQVVYSQEVRMYILVAFLGMGVAYAWGRWIETYTPLPVDRVRPRLVWSVLYVLAASAGLWTHYSFPIVLAALNVAWLVWWLRTRDSAERWRILIWWLGMHAAVVLLYFPWLLTALDKILHYGPISVGQSVASIVSQALKLLSVGESAPDDDLTLWLTVAMVGLAVFGAWSGLALRGEGRRRLSFVYTLGLILLVVAPIAMMVGLTLTGRPAYRPKFFLVASPAFCMLAGLGIAVLEHSPEPRRTLSNQLWLLLGMGIVGLSAARSLHNYYVDPDYARADYRGIARDIRSAEREGDAILLNAPNQWEVFTYYYRGQIPVYPLPRSRPPREEQVIDELERIADQHRRVFALYWATDESDPERIVERWLEANAYKAADTWYGDVRLVTYALPEAESAEMAHSLEDVRLGEAIALHGYTLAPEDVECGDILQVTLFWEALDVPPGRYKVFLHLVDDQEQIVSQYDGEPGHGLNLTTQWRPERGTFPDRYGVSVPDALAPGTYRLLAGMYDVSGAPRLPISSAGESIGDVLTLTTIEIPEKE